MAATEKMHTEVPTKGHFPPFERETFASQLFWLVIAFVVLYVMMSRLAIPRIGGIIAARANCVGQDIADAKRLKSESDAAIAAHENALADARSRAQALAIEMREKHALEAEGARKALDATLNGRIAEAERMIATARASAMANVGDIAVGTAAAIVERLMGATPAADNVDRAVADALKR